MGFRLFYSRHHDQVFICDNLGKVEITKCSRDKDGHLSASFARSRTPRFSDTWVYLGEF